MNQPVITADLLATLKAAGNLTISQRVMVGLFVEGEERKSARARQRATGGKHYGKAQVVQVGSRPMKGRAADAAAKVAGLSRRSYEKARDIVLAAQDDENADGIRRSMDLHGSIDRAWRDFKALTGKDSANRLASVCKSIARAIGEVEKLEIDPTGKAAVIQNLRNGREILFSHGKEKK